MQWASHVSSGAPEKVLDADTVVLADQTYDADWLRRRIEATGAAPNIPAWGSSPLETLLQPVLYGPRNRIERFIPMTRHSLREAYRELHRHAQLRCSQPLATPE